MISNFERAQYRFSNLVTHDISQTLWALSASNPPVAISSSKEELAATCANLIGLLSRTDLLHSVLGATTQPCTIDTHADADSAENGTDGSEHAAHFLRSH